MDEREHFKRFKKSHRDGMLRQVERASFTKTNGNGISSPAEVLREAVLPPKKPTLLERFLPYGRQMRMTQEAKGVFIPYPLLGIIITLCTILVGGIIAIQVQVSNLSTTILLRDADQRAATKQLQEKTEQLQVYIYDSREKLIRLQTQAENEKRR